MAEEQSLSSWFKAYWPFLLLALGYLIQLVKVVHYQRSRLEHPQHYGDAHLPLWKLVLFLLPGVPLVYSFFELFLFDALIKVIIMTRQADKKKARGDLGVPEPMPVPLRTETVDGDGRSRGSPVDPTLRAQREDAVMAANPNLRRGQYPYQP